MTSGLESVAALKDLHLEGNIIPMEWFAHLKFENGKPDVNAILILSDIVYWYRPVQVRDEETGQVIGYRKKFKSDLLQKSYQHYATLFGLSKRQVIDAIVRLEERGMITRVFRTIESSAVILHNVLFIALNVGKMASLQASVGGATIGRGTPHNRMGDPPRFIGAPPTIERGTYTEITTQNTTKITTDLPPPLRLPREEEEKQEEEEDDDLILKHQEEMAKEGKLAVYTPPDEASFSLTIAQKQEEKEGPQSLRKMPLSLEDEGVGLQLITDPGAIPHALEIASSDPTSQELLATPSTYAKASADKRLRRTSRRTRSVRQAKLERAEPEGRGHFLEEGSPALESLSFAQPPRRGKSKCVGYSSQGSSFIGQDSQIPGEKPANILALDACSLAFPQRSPLPSQASLAPDPRAWVPDGRDLTLAMVEIWNQVVQCHFPVKMVHLTPQRAERLMALCDAALGGRNSNPLEAWEQYCQTIAQTRFLMGQGLNGFRVSLDWASRSENARKVLEGAIYDKADSRLKSSPKACSSGVFVERLHQHLADKPYGQEWLAISVHLARFLGQDLYEAWFSHVTIHEFTDTTLILRVENTFKHDWIASRYWLDLETAVKAAYPNIQHIIIETSQGDSEQ